MLRLIYNALWEHRKEYLSLPEGSDFELVFRLS